MAPFYGWSSTASRLEPLQGGSLLFTTKFPEIPGSHFIDQRKDERLSQPWSHPVVLNAGPLDCESSTLTALLKFSTKLAWTLNKKNLLASLHCLYALYHILNHRIENQSHLIHLARAKSKQNHFHLHYDQLVVCLIYWIYCYVMAQIFLINIWICIIIRTRSFCWWFSISPSIKSLDSLLLPVSITNIPPYDNIKVSLR